MYSEAEFKRVLSQNWNPHTVDVMKRLLQEWDSQGLPTNVTVQEDFKTPCKPEYVAHGHVLVGQEIVADAYLYKELPAHLVENAQALRSVREVLPTLRFIYGKAENHLRNTLIAGEGEHKGHLILTERVPQPSHGTLGEWVTKLSDNVPGLNRLLAFALQLDYLWTLLIEEGFDGNLDALTDVQAIKVDSEAVVTCYGADIKTHGYMPFVTNTLRLRKGEPTEAAKDPRAILKYVLNMTVLKSAPVAELATNVRKSLDTIDFTSPLKAYFGISSYLPAEGGKPLSCKAIYCADTNTLYNILKGKGVEQQAARHLEFFQRAEGAFPKEVQELVDEMKRYLTWRYYHDEAWAATRVEDIDAYLMDAKAAGAVSVPVPQVSQIQGYQKLYADTLPQLIKNNLEACRATSETKGRPFTKEDIGNTDLNVHITHDMLMSGVDTVGFATFPFGSETLTVTGYNADDDGDMFYRLNVNGQEEYVSDTELQARYGYNPYINIVVSGADVQPTQDVDSVMVWYQGQNSRYGMSGLTVYPKGPCDIDSDVTHHLNAIVILSLMPNLID